MKLRKNFGKINENQRKNDGNLKFNEYFIGKTLKK